MGKGKILDYVLDSEEILDDLPEFEEPWYKEQIKRVQWNMEELKGKLKKMIEKEKSMTKNFEIPELKVTRIDDTNELAIVDKTGKLIGIGKLVYKDTEKNDNREIN